MEFLPEFEGESSSGDRNLEARGENTVEDPPDTAEIAESPEIDGSIDSVESPMDRLDGSSEPTRRRYTRSEMEALRYVNLEGQKRRWDEIYRGLGILVARELDQIVSTKDHKKQAHKDTGRRRKRGAKNSADDDNSSEVLFQATVSSFDEASFMDLTPNDDFDGKEDCIGLEEEYDEEEDSDGDYDSIQRPAFFVPGEPDFESGPPQDGLEYLRRVRWEAAQIPKVKVVRIDEKKLNREQTPYMPSIPEIPKWPLHLLPSKQWEDAFLADFINLRQTLAEFENFSSQCPAKLPSFPTDNSKIPDSQLLLKSSPTLSAITSMDVVTRSSMLRSRIKSFETAAVLSRADCMWLFALCAGVDVPLNAEMGASLRCLLRKCASLRVHKLEYDDEIVMLNMLITIAGRFFGQSEN